MVPVAGVICQTPVAGSGINSRNRIPDLKNGKRTDEQGEVEMIGLDMSFIIQAPNQCTLERPYPWFRPASAPDAGSPAHEASAMPPLAHQGSGT